MSDKEDVRVATPNRLSSSTGPASGSGPSGFDPARECLTPETYYEVSQESPRTLVVRLRFPFDIDDWAQGNSAIPDMPAGAVDGSDAERFRRYEARNSERERIHQLVHDQMEPVGADCYGVLLKRDARIGEDRVGYGVRHARWRRTRQGERPAPRDTDRSGEADETPQAAQPEARAGAEGIAQTPVSERERRLEEALEEVKRLLEAAAKEPRAADRSILANRALGLARSALNPTPEGGGSNAG